ncbi:MAG TPA: isochorismatase family cysteine hydrolase [Solirubrobacteraceae bacterium]|jgi:nicotinamidase-related amidase
MGTALLVVDMLNGYNHPDSDSLMNSVREVVPVIAGLVAEARERGLAVVYVNDNHGDWTAGRRELVQAARQGPDRELIDPIVPPPDAPLVIKARHSIFYSTAAEYLLRQLGTERLILTGQVTEQCILYSALDAYVRHFEVVVPRDAVAHIHADLADAALRMMERNMSARIDTSDGLLDRLCG